MAGYELDRHGNMRVTFTLELPTGKYEIRQSLGIGKYSRANERWFDKYVKEPIEKALLMENRVELLYQILPKNETLKELARNANGTDLTLSIKDLLQLVQDDYDANGYSNAGRFKSTVKHVREYFEGVSASDPQIVDRIEAYKKQRREDGAKNATINRELSAIRRGYRLAETKLKVIPKIRILKENNARKGFFTQEEFAAVLKYLPDYLQAVAKVLYITGWRKGEVLSRQWRHVDLVEGWLRLEPGETKNGEGRNFPLDFPGLMPVIEELKARRERELAEGKIYKWLFHRGDGEQIVGFRKAWDTAMELALEAGEIAERRLVHDFRRTAVSNLEHLAIPQKAAMKLTGHLTDAVYRRYSIANKKTLRWVAGEARAALTAGRGGQLLGEITPPVPHPLEAGVKKARK